MSIPYKRSFNKGRQSEQFYNDDLFEHYEATKHLLEVPDNMDEGPEGNIDGALWLNRDSNELKAYSKKSGKWNNIFEDKFALFEHLTDAIAPNDPVKGMLWIYSDVLCYYDGSKWKPIKALEQDSSQFNLSIFDDYLLASPLWKQGTTVVNDQDIEEFLNKRKQYLQAKLDLIANSEFKGDGTKWEPGDMETGDVVSSLEINIEGNSQFLVPNIRYDRIFVEDMLDRNYEKQSDVCIQYPRQYLLTKTPSLIHVNPGRITSITKRLFKVDPTNPRIEISTEYTEFYGFANNDIHGHFLRPEAEDDDGGYIIAQNGPGIILSYDQAQAYNYVLAVQFDFSWLKNTGSLQIVNSKDAATTYYIPNFSGNNAVFADGNNLSDSVYYDDDLSKVISVTDDIKDMDVQTLHSLHKEFGYVREESLNHEAKITVLRDFKQPLVFLNGEAMNSACNEIKYIDNTFYITNGRINMAYTILELSDSNHPLVNSDGDYIDDENNPIDEDGYIITSKTPIMASDGTTIIGYQNTVDKTRGKRDRKCYNMLESQGIVSKADQNGQGYIEYKSSDIGGELIKDENGTTTGVLATHVVLFIDGMIIKPEDIEIDTIKRTITVNGLRPGQDYILLQDRYDYMTNAGSLLPALAVDKVSESLVYLNGLLLLNDTAVRCVNTPAQMSPTCANHEVKYFILSDFDDTNGEFKEYDAYEGVWNTMSDQDIAGIKSFCYSYENSTRAISLNLEIDRSEDDLDVYAFNYANDIEHALTIRNLPTKKDNTYSSLYVVDKSIFTIPDTYTPGVGGLMVWVNGVRQYPDAVIEHDTGTAFELVKPVTGIVSYIIEQPESGYTKVAETEILTKDNAVDSTYNLYKTEKPLYPGRVVIYIDGIRQPETAYNILDNYTILFNGDTKLLGTSKNYPVETVNNENDPANPIFVNHTQEDKILVEVKTNCEWTENYFKLNSTNLNYIVTLSEYNLPTGIVSSTDELVIFINGLFFGLRNEDGYKKDATRGTVTITREEVINRLISDPFYEFLMENEQAKLEYMNTHKGKMYTPTAKDMIIEWR